jgi:hypothetical protein
MAAKGKLQLAPGVDLDEMPDDSEFEFPQFATEKELQAWIASLPRVQAEVHPLLKGKRVSVTFKFTRLMVEGFDHLAKQKGIRDGRTLMYMVLNQYLNDNLPEDF